MPLPFQLPEASAAERTPLVEQLLGLIADLLERNQQQAETLQQLRDEMAVLKGEKAKPNFKPSGMAQNTDPDGPPSGPAEKGTGNGKPDSADKRPGSTKRHKTAELTIHEEVSLAPAQPLPEGSRFKGYRDVVIQDLRSSAHNTRYRLEVWQTPDGEWVCGELPAPLRDGRFGPELRRFVIYQHHQRHVTQPLLHEQLREFGIDLSVGQIDALLSGRNKACFAEKDQFLATGLHVSRTSPWTTPGRAIKARTATSPRSATTSSPGSPAPAARAGSTFWNCSTPAQSTMSSTSTPWSIGPNRGRPWRRVSSSRPAGRGRSRSPTAGRS